MFNKILIANRGEIACRIAATCKRLGVASVAVYSDADASAKHVAACDEAVHIGAAPASESYLRIDRIIDAALKRGAQAVHPGYGFLSENEDFAHACETAGLVFVGPPVSAIATMGSKAAAKALMHAAAVPLVPGYHGENQDPELLQREANDIGYPVLIKASAGGGGKGMRVVDRREDFASALAACKREAKSGFGNDRVLIEKYLTRPRHVEVQVFADKHGEAVYLFDRDCSVQRRHQKVLEEAPAPGLTDELRWAMGEAAVAAARAVSYVGAGTVEFIMTGSDFYFMEMNTRLQVEHPVTEMVTGLDLVEWQFRVAAGEPLPLRQNELSIEGHAIEARLYAENPSRGFLPSTGTLKYLRMPEGIEFTVGSPTRATVRVDSGVREGDEITPFYDPMIAKLIVHGSNREEALARMTRALEACEAVGPHTNIEFLRRVVASAPFASAQLDTGLIERHHDTLFANDAKLTKEVVALATAALLTREGGAAHGNSPWDALSQWRLNGGYRQSIEWRELTNNTVCQVAYTRDGEVAALQHPQWMEAFDWWRGQEPHTFGVHLGDTRVTGRVLVDGDVFHVFHEGIAMALEWTNLLAHAADSDHGEGRLTAPMPGRVIAVLVSPGAVVEKGTALIVMEAMKMEHTIGAPAAGRVVEVFYRVGDQVTDGAQLLEMESGE
jgi:3-methylcrotonyl-CoA carboxylase alpha subunit